MKDASAYAGREQTYVKHFILEHYLEKVAYNVASSQNCFTYVDGFAGPWKSASEKYEDTSFVIALETLRKVRAGLRPRKELRIRCVFVEEDAAAYRLLRDKVGEYGDVEIFTFNKRFEDAIPDIRRAVGREFALMFIDPTGWTGFPLESLRQLFASPAWGEVLINLMYGHLHRFLDHPSPGVRASVQALFGDELWKEKLEQDGGEDEVVRLYAEKLGSACSFKFATSTRVLKPVEDRTHFHLIYGTRHPKGLLVFRDVEKRAYDEQRLARGQAQNRVERDRTGQTDLFSLFGVRVPVEGPDDRTRNLQRARTDVVSRIERTDALTFGDLLDLALVTPLVWDTDVESWVRELVAAGEVVVEGMGPRERKPKRHHVVRRIPRGTP